MAERLELLAPVMGRATGFHQHLGGCAVGEEAAHPRSGEAMPFVNAARLMGDGDFNNALCQVDADLRRLHVDSFLMGGLRGRFVVHGTLVPFGGGVHPISCCWRGVHV